MDLLPHAVSNNVAWCALVCTEGGVNDRPTGTWRVSGSPAPLFPDAVTLRPGVSADQLAAVLADRPVCSVKDSYADVDLEPHDFGPLFTGRWIGREPAPVCSSPGWSPVTNQAELERWCAAAELPEVLPTRLLRDPSVRVLAAHHDGVLAAGAIVNVTGAVVGLSNVFQVHCVWDQVSSVVAGFFPGLPIVGYEHGAELDAALATGFSARFASGSGGDCSRRGRTARAGALSGGRR